jgi:hypothetical protein
VDQKQVKHAHAQIEAVQHHVAYDHYGNQPEPDETHHDETPDKRTTVEICGFPSFSPKEAERMGHGAFTGQFA